MGCFDVVNGTSFGPKDTDRGCLADVMKPLELFPYLQVCVAALSLKSLDQETGEGGGGEGRGQLTVGLLVLSAS